MSHHGYRVPGVSLAKPKGVCLVDVMVSASLDSRGGWSRFLINLLIFFVTSNSVKLAGKVAILAKPNGYKQS